MYKITSEQLKWAFESPACRFMMTTGDSYCAVGKVATLCLGEDVVRQNITSFADGITQHGKPVTDFLSAIKHFTGKSWASYANINDTEEGSLQDNHRKALRALLQDALAAGFIELEDEVAKEFFYTLQGTTVDEMA